MIASFHDKDTEKVFNRQFVKRWHVEIQRKGKEKLAILNAAATLDDLKVPPGNELEPLKGDRSGQHCIRINDQWRVCFVWNSGSVERVEICDYH
jgi:proteic killer suppression protein